MAIDPHGGGDRGPQEIAPDATRGDEDHDAFVANLDAQGSASGCATSARCLTTHSRSCPAR